jgi:hypothetical protein
MQMRHEPAAKPMVHPALAIVISRCYYPFAQNEHSWLIIAPKTMTAGSEGDDNGCRNKHPRIIARSGKDNA